MWSVWSTEFVDWASRQTQSGVNGVWALGTVLALHMGSADGVAGYQSNAARGAQAAIAEGATADGSIHSRVLGNVLYLMAGQKTREETVRRAERLLRRALRDGPTRLT